MPSSSSSSSNRTTTVPLSFDRFRARSIEFLSPFRNHHCDKQIKRSLDRSCTRKSQVHPNNVKSPNCDQMNYDAAHLFHADKYSNSKTSLLLPKHLQIKKRPLNYFYTRPTPNVTKPFDVYKLSVTNTAPSPETIVTGCKCPPTPYMIDYRHSSLPNLVPTRVIKRPKPSNQSIKPHDVDEFNA